ncbi:MAG: hypothetical protein FWE81_02830, partial [Rikenellaceae bacterium]|nr:hypothetical protein [Rikenellaceae bacterium]
NEGLDFILADLMAEKIRLFEESGGNSATRSSSGGAFPETFDFEQLVINSTGRFMRTVDPTLDDNFLDVVMSSTRSFTRSTAEVTEVLTPFQQEYWQRMVDIVYREDMNPVLLRKEISKLEKEIIREAPTVEEAEQLLYATSVAVHSAEYWTENLAKWNTVLNSQIVRTIDPDEDLYQEIMQSVATRSGNTPGIIPQMPEGFYPVPGDPEWYIYVNEDGVMFLLPCPPGLIWNADKCYCDWPEFVWQQYQNSHSSFSVRDILIEDATGAAVGGIVGAGTGAVAIPGIGSIPGYAFGAITGGLTFSAAEGIKQLFNW